VSGHPLRVAVVGAGQVAARHVDAFAAHADTSVVAVADPLLDRAEALASRTDGRAYADFEAMLDVEDVDAVCVCVPHDLHLDVARAAVAADAHLLMEKPIATTLDDADQMIALVGGAGLTMMIGFVHRFRQEVLEAKRLVDEGALGTPATALDKFCSLGGAHPPGWVWDRARAGGGVLMYGGIHAVDRILWLLDTTAETVYARAHAYTDRGGDVEDGLVAVLSLANGVTATLFENSPPYGRPGGWETELFGSDGAVRVRTGEWCELTSLERSVTVQSRDELHFHREVEEFVAAIREQREPSVPASTGRTTLQVACAIYESARTGAPVDVASVGAAQPVVQGGPA
jgi:predicted dehydrogenase